MSDTDFAKTQLQKHLINILVPAISDGMWSIHSAANELCTRNKQKDQILFTFQNMLAKIKEWNEDTINTEVKRILQVSNCSYLDDLIMGVFLAYLKSFASIHYRGKSPTVSVPFERPSVGTFLHKTYIQSARKLWQVAYLFNTNVATEQQARHRQEIEGHIRDSIEQVIQSFLPWETITKSMSTSVDEEEEEEEDEEKIVQFKEEEEEEDKPPITISEETATIDVEQDEDPIKDIEKKMSEDVLVLKL